MLTKFQNNIHKFQLTNSQTALAISGGLDSMVLLDLCLKTGLEIMVLHCNFKLRNIESDEDEKFVIEFCKTNKILYKTIDFDTKPFAEKNELSIQMAARKLRYDWFSDQMQKLKIDYLCTAHHLDDSLETFLINLSRGTGIEGLLGVPEINRQIIRPLLDFSREEIERYAIENNILWREDSSNKKDNYLRNDIRHNVIPNLKNVSDNFLNGFQNTINHLKSTKDLAKDAVQFVYNEVVTEKENQFCIDLEKLKKYENKNSYLYYWLKDFGFKAWNDIYDLVEANTGKQIFSATHQILKNRNQLLIQPITNEELREFEIQECTKSIEFPIKMRFSEPTNVGESSKSSIYIDADLIQYPLKIRKTTEGDFFYPTGMKGKKKVSKYFKDEKFSIFDKQKTWLLCSDNQVVWIIGHRQDERFRVTKNTKNILQINFQN